MKAGTSVQAIADTRWRRSTVRSRISRPSGAIIAPPAPCSTRAATMVGRLSASEHRMEPPMNTQMEALNTRRSPKRSAIAPLAGISTASASR